MSDYLLSICIPTANRRLELNKQLLGINAQIEKLDNTSLIQIVIGDNTDVEEQSIDIEQFKNLNLKYIKNSKNIGYAYNVNNIICNADGEFCWLLSDDCFLQVRIPHYCNYFSPLPSGEF